MPAYACITSVSRRAASLHDVNGRGAKVEATDDRGRITAKSEAAVGHVGQQVLVLVPLLSKVLFEQRDRLLVNLLVGVLLW